MNLAHGKPSECLLLENARSEERVIHNGDIQKKRPTLKFYEKSSYYEYLYRNTYYRSICDMAQLIYAKSQYMSYYVTFTIIIFITESKSC